MDTLRLVFTAIYILIDLVYVVFSKPVYDEVVKAIQGEYMAPVSGLAKGIAFVGAYTCMALGWYFLAAGTAMTWSKTNTSSSMSPLKAGALAGLVFGLAVIGTFNFTLFLMFKNYNLRILARDMTWGIGWPVVATIIYTLLAFKK